MGIYLNPNNRNFQKTLNSLVYVDKTLLISHINAVLDTNDNCICVSRPRRFGKTIAADMLAAYYSKGCCSLPLFASLKIAHTDSYQKNLNTFNVIKFDLSEEYQNVEDKKELFNYINRKIGKEFQEEFPEVDFVDCKTLPDYILAVYKVLGQTFILIIDEYDVLIRERVENSLYEKSLSFFNALFKGAAINAAISLAYVTGILPIVKDKVQSKLNNFTQYTMLDSGALTEFVGFTSEEVQELCKNAGVDFENCRRWYNGYSQNNYELYNPKSIAELVKNKKFNNYWNATGSYEAIKDYILLDFDGIRSDVTRLLAGERIPINPQLFLNTLHNFSSKNEVFTLLIHLGYLAFDEIAQQCFIPNNEIRQEWVNALSTTTEYIKLMDIINQSKELLEATIQGRASVVAKALNKAHSWSTSNLTYNNEGSFQSAICLAYFYAATQYTIIKELPSGKGYADVAFIPYSLGIPAIIVELKNNKSAESALQQIKNKEYKQALQHYHGNLLFVGISYDENTKEHDCKIETVVYE